MNTNKIKLADIIQRVSETNKELMLTNKELVLGISIDKEFMPSVANLNGTDLSKYSVLRKNRFAYNPMHVGRDERLPIALYRSNEVALISPAYEMFEIKPDSQIDLDYLMLVFKTSWFDKACWFYTDSSVRGGLSYNDFCNIEIELPSLDEQQKLVRQYNTIVNRIDVLEKINKTLEYAIYISIQLECVNGTKVVKVRDLITLFDYLRKPLNDFERSSMKKTYPYYGAATLVDYVDNYLFDGEFGLLGEDGSVITDIGTPVMQYVNGKFWVNNHAHVFQGNQDYNTSFAFYILKNIDVSSIITGGVQGKINQKNLLNLDVIIPKDNNKLQQKIKTISDMILLHQQEINQLTKLRLHLITLL